MSVRSLRALGLSAIALCLAAVFGFSVAGLTSRDRSGRQQQRSRSQRHTRQRLCQGLSQSPCAIQAALRNNVQASDPPAAECPPGQADFAFTPESLIELRPIPGVSPVLPLLHSLPRPPPLFA